MVDETPSSSSSRCQRALYPLYDLRARSARVVMSSARAVHSHARSTVRAHDAQRTRRRRRPAVVVTRATTAESVVPRGDTAGAVVALASNLRVTTGDNDLIVGTATADSVDIRIEPNEICGLVGANGCGKSTLVKCLSGARGVDDGYARVAYGAVVGVLEQTAVSGVTTTVEEEAMSRMTHVRAVEAALDEATRALEAGVDGAAAALALANEQWDAVGGATAKKRVSNVLKGLGFSEAMFSAPCDTLSGGWQMRVALARLLLSPAGDCAEKGVNGGLLLLDEPSNHLDAKARDWLVSWIKSYQGTVVLVSHDEELLNCVNRVVEVRGRKLHNYKGDYKRFLREREARRKVAVATLERENVKAEKLDNFITKFGAKATKASAAKSKQKALDKVNAKMETFAELAGDGPLGDGPGDARKVILKLPTPPAGAREILIAKSLDVGYKTTESTLVSGVNLTVRKGDRLLVLGPNGAGKSTFLKTIGGELEPMGGAVIRGEGAVVGYFSQDLAQELPTEVTALTHVLDVARKIDRSVTNETARGVLGALGITGPAAVDRTIGSLSGGEKARVALAAFVLRPVNVLLLDEASNHLDGTAIEALCTGLRGWEGAVVAITHNSAFAAALNPTVVARVENGELSTHMHIPGVPLVVGDFCVSTNERVDAMEMQMKKEAEEERRAKEAIAKEVRNAPKVIDKIERAMTVIETEIAQLDEKLLAAGADVAKCAELQALKDAKEQKSLLYMTEWERLDALCAAHEAKHGSGVS